MDPRFFDHAAGAALIQQAKDAWLRTALDFPANPASIHPAGLAARSEAESLRSRTARLLGTTPARLVFTSGATEANAAVFFGLFAKSRPAHAVVSAFEHPSVHDAACWLERAGWRVSWLPWKSCTPEGVQAALAPDTRLVSIMAVNNETGSQQDISGIAQMLGAHGKAGGRAIHFHSDCTQLIGKAPFRFDGSGLDSATASAHKFGGPRGIGYLCLRHPLPAFPPGSGQDNGVRSGTQNLPGMAGALTALELTLDRLPATQRHLQELFTTFAACLNGVPGVHMLPEGREAMADFSPAIVTVSIAGIPGEVAIRVLGDQGFMVSSGAACSSRNRRNHRIADAYGIPHHLSEQSIRISFGLSNTVKTVAQLCSAIKRLSEKPPL